MEDRQIMYWRERMTPVFSEMNVDLVLSGHDHIYTRTYLMDEQKPVDFGAPVPNGGVVEKKTGQVQYVTANSSSGSKYYKFFDFKTGKRDETDANTTDFEQSVQDKTARTYTAFWNQNMSPDYTNVEVTPEGLKVTTFDVNDGELDSFTLKRAASDTKPPEFKTTEEPTKPTEPRGKGSSQGSGESSAKNAGAAIGVLAGLLALIGGGFVALTQGLLPPQIAAMLKI